MSPAASKDQPCGFTYRASVRETKALHCDAVSLASLTSQFDTPLYVYSASLIRERLQTFDQVFHAIPHTVCYSVKANSNLSVLRLLAKLGCGFDVVSGGELERVLAVGRSLARKVVFSGVGKAREEMQAALSANILLFNVESESELEALAETASQLKKTARIALRVNPDVPADTHPYISTGLHQHKFGVPVKESLRLYARADSVKNMEVAGVSVHIGSQITDPKPFAAAMKRVADLVRTLRKNGHKIQYIDAGGGLGISYQHEKRDDFKKQVSGYSKALLNSLRGLGVHLLLEPGRSIVGPAGVLLTKVVYRKQNGTKKFVIVDAAMNDLLRPSLYDAFHEIVPVIKNKVASPEIIDVVGPVCESGDFLARNRKLPKTEEGDLLAVLDTGAYGMVLSSNYNTRPRPAEIMVDGKRVTVIRQRESVDDLLRLER